MRNASIDPTRSYLRRAPGCLGSFLGFVVLLTLADYARPMVPKPVVVLASLAAGVGLVHLYGRVARRRWGVAIPDVVRVVKRDVSSFKGMEAADYRLRFSPGTQASDRALHELLYALKWLGHYLIFAGLGSILYAVMRSLGIVDAVAKLG